MSRSEKPSKHWKLKQNAKYWLGSKFGPTKGKIKYFGTDVYFPIGHELFYRICDQGVYEASLLNAIKNHLPADGLLFDIGANIGLTAIPLLNMFPECRVISFEPSPNSLPYLKKTQGASQLGDRWTVVEKAVGETSGKIHFEINSQADGAFDSRQSTGRKSNVAVTSVPMTTVDEAWQNLGKPNLAVVKIDVEGFEKEVLAGAEECLNENRPVVILEWSRANLNGLGRDPFELIELANNAGYEVISMDSGRHVANETVLSYEMLSTENFLLFPRQL